MNIEVIKNEKPDLDHGKMVCDTGLHKKLNEYELTKHFNNHSFNMLIGRPRSGKSSLAQGLFRSNKVFKKVFHKIVLFQPPNSRGSIKDDIFNKIPPEDIYDELTVLDLKKVIAQFKAEPELNKAIILDDMGAYLKNNEIQQLLKELVFNRRHLRVSIFVMAQSYKSLPLDLRKLVTNFIIFKVSKMELNEIFSENIESLNAFTDEISKVVFDKPHQFLFANIEDRKLYKNWDELVIKLPN